jgi:Tfp pilus assembly protein PilO
MPTKEEELTTKYQLQLYDTVSLSQLVEQNVAVRQCMEYLNINTDN